MRARFGRAKPGRVRRKRTDLARKEVDEEVTEALLVIGLIARKGSEKRKGDKGTEALLFASISDHDKNTFAPRFSLSLSLSLFFIFLLRPSSSHLDFLQVN